MENDGIGHTKLLVARHHKVYQNLRWRMRQVSTQQVASPTTGRKADAELSTRTAMDAYFGRLNIGSMPSHPSFGNLFTHTCFVHVSSLPLVTTAVE